MAHPVVRLKALTPEAAYALGGSYLEIEKFPFRVGRESRMTPARFPWFKERRSKAVAPNNDLYIREFSERHHLSREHFLIDWREGELVLVDRGSACGTIVEGKPIGGERYGGECALKHHDVIIAGISSSPYVFKVCIEDLTALEKSDVTSMMDGRFRSLE